MTRLRHSSSHMISALRVMAWVIALFYFKFLFFDLVWAIDTTFSGFQFPQGWLTKLIFASILALPLLCIRSKWYVGVMGLIIDIWLVCNLMYFRTYFTVIPLSSYALTGNLEGFHDSVWESVQLVDVVFPLSTAMAVALLWRVPLRRLFAETWSRVAKRIALWGIGFPAIVVLVWVLFKGGYKQAYEKLMYDYSTCGAAVYTIPGTWLYGALAEETELTPAIEERIDRWLAEKPQLGPLDYDIVPPQNVIILLCESLESWVIGTEVEGQVITPTLNSLVNEPAVLYAPKVLNQVGGARSIDAQLILHTGLLPISYGAYSWRYPHHHYATIDKAFKEAYPDSSRTMSFTVDKKTVWNVAIVAYDFGYERLVDKPNFLLDVKTGARGRLGDDSFLRQSYEKITDTTQQLWVHGGNNLLQLVTYSGHSPFVIPDSLKQLTFSKNIPERLRNYMQVANYTDRAIGNFISKLRSNPEFDNTMIVITGDHEGIGVDRNSFLRDPYVASWLSDNQFVPFIVVNSPVEMRYEGVMGQIDIYPTLLDLTGLNGYHWHGLGGSILRDGKKPYAISWTREVVGDASEASPQELDHARDAYTISDLIISCDYFAPHD